MKTRPESVMVLTVESVMALCWFVCRMGQMMYRSPALRWTTAKAPPPRDRTVHTNQPPVKSPASLGKRDTMTGRFWKDWRMGCGVTRNLRSSVAFWWSDGAGRSKDGIRYDTIIYRCLYGILRCRWSLRVWWGGCSLNTWCRNPPPTKLVQIYPCMFLWFL